MENPGDKARILFLDIEATNLAADFGQMLCCGFKWLDERKPFVLTMLDYGDGIGDKILTEKVVEVVNQADIAVTYYGRRYDFPFINTRALRTPKRNIIGLSKGSHIDLWETVRRELKLRGNRLSRVIEYLELDHSKTPVKGPEWMDAQRCPRCDGRKVQKAMAYIVDHCEQDVLALEDAYNELLPLIERHPRIYEKLKGEDQCPNCGSKDFQHRGYSATEGAKRKPRLRCSNPACGKWFFGRVTQ